MIKYKKIDNSEIPIKLLYLADEDEDQIQKYLNDSIFFAAIIETQIIGTIGLNELENNKIEIVSIAVKEEWQNKKIGRNLITEAVDYAKDKKYKEIIIRTGNCGLHQLKLYMKSGFRMFDIKQNYFPQNYKIPIYENDIQCLDQVTLNYNIYSKKEIKQRIEEYWKLFIDKNPEYTEKKYDVWSFGYGDYQANQLLGYVKQGFKTGTSSAYDLYPKDEKKPEVNDLSIITYGNGLPGCIIETVEIRNKIFNEINEEEAKLEGEGDLSLKYWRTEHQNFFTKEYQALGLEFSNTIPVIYEIFKVVFDADIKD